MNKLKSLEALEAIENIDFRESAMQNPDYIIKDCYKEEINLIKRDLEILQLIMKRFSIRKEQDIKHAISIVEMQPITNDLEDEELEEFIQIKELMDNE